MVAVETTWRTVGTAAGTAEGLPGVPVAAPDPLAAAPDDEPNPDTVVPDMLAAESWAPPLLPHPDSTPTSTGRAMATNAALRTWGWTVPAARKFPAGAIGTLLA